MEPYSQSIPDEVLITRSLEGDSKSLEELIIRYSGLVYTLIIKMIRNKDDAADLSQEVFIKLITKLDSFKHNSSFKTWLYKITVNHVLNYKKSTTRRRGGFIQFAKDLDGAPDLEISAGEYYEADQQLLIEETKQTCMSGMLLCLDARHRLVFILGELFGINDRIGAEVLDISPENFRVILSRGKRDLYNFMHNKCGLVNKANPCRCEKKTQAFIKMGIVNPGSLRFAGHHLKKIADVSEEKQKVLDNFLDNEYRELYLQHSFLENPDWVRTLRELLASEKVNQLFNNNKKTGHESDSF